MQNFRAVVTANFKWFITMMAMAIGSYYALSAKVEVNENDIKLNREKIEWNTDTTVVLASEIEKLIIIRDIKCQKCGGSFIYDSTLYFRPLRIFSNDSFGIGTDGFKTDLHIK